MREIKFRAWDLENKRMCQVNQITFGVENHMVLATYQTGYMTHGNSFVLMQYTGLKDKNGKEIYEGDIILGDAVVVWRNEPELDRDHCCFGIANGKYTLGTYSDRDDFEVIGNVYETPDLIKTT